MFAELQFSPYIILLETINLDCPYYEHEKHINIGIKSKFLNYARYTDILSRRSGFKHLVFCSQISSKIPDIIIERQRGYLFFNYVVKGISYSMFQSKTIRTQVKGLRRITYSYLFIAGSTHIHCLQCYLISSQQFTVALVGTQVM